VRAALIGLGRLGLRHLEVINSLQFDVVGASDRFEQTYTKAQEAGLPRDRPFTNPVVMFPTEDLVPLADIYVASISTTIRWVSSSSTMIVTDTGMMNTKGRLA
jgi:hypothetical protein